MTHASISSADLTSLARRAKQEAETRGLLVLPAMMRTEAEVVFGYPQVTLEQALDVAHEVGAPFIAIDTVRFDAAGFLADYIEDEEAVSAIAENLLEAAADREGEPAFVWVRWVSSGTPYTFLATATWHRELSDRLDDWVEQRGDVDRAENDQATARIQELAEIAAGTPELRAVKTSQRTAVAQQIIRGVAPEEDDAIIGQAVTWAVFSVRDANSGAYFNLESQVGDLAEIIAGMPTWRAERAAAKRRQVIRDYLIGAATDGYAPTDTFVKRLDELAAVRP